MKIPAVATGVQVGAHYKSPRYPIWVVGSQSHFTVMFSLDPQSNEQSPSSVAFREFSKHDETKNKFINSSDLRAVVTALGTPVCVLLLTAAKCGSCHILSLLLLLLLLLLLCVGERQLLNALSRWQQSCGALCCVLFG